MRKYKNINTTRIKRYTTICRALSEPHRWLILQYLLLQQSPCPVGEVVGQLKIAHATVSHHLQQLELAGLIRRRRKGRFIYCQAKGKAITELAAFLRQLGRDDNASDEQPQERLWDAFSHIWG